jgi:predicted membrane protein (TIGR00267 family)
MRSFGKIRDYIRISRVSSISRRYFVMNAFDGAMTVLGIIIGAYVAGITDPSWVISAGLGASLAMGLSGFAGAYMTEEAERSRALNNLEKSMLKSLENSVIGEASRFASLWTAIVDGISPAIAAVFCLVPFFLSFFNAFSIDLAIKLSIIITLLILFSLGMYLGKVSDRNVFLQGTKMLVVGLILTVVLIIFRLV